MSERGELISLAVERARRADTAEDVSPEQLLEIMRDMLANNELDGTPTRMIAMIECETENGGKSFHPFRAKADRYQELAMLSQWTYFNNMEWSG